MYTVLFVDDDPLILRKLQGAIDWEACGFFVLPPAKDGIHALQLFNEHHVDLLLCDVNMPRMDGLALSREVHTRFPSLPIILLTVNDSFACAQQALNLGITQYLLKPIHNEELLEAVQKALNNLQDEVALEELKSKASLGERPARDIFLSYLVSGYRNMTESQVQEKFNLYNIVFHFDPYQIISVHINEFEQKIPCQDLNDKLINKIVTCIENTVYTYAKAIVFCDGLYQVNVILEVSPFRAYYLNEAIQIAQSIYKALQFEMNLSSTLIISRVYQDFSEIYRCYYETQYFSPLTDAYRKQKILVYEQLIGQKTLPNLDYNELRKQVLLYLRTKNRERLSKLVNSTLNELYEHHSLEIFNITKMDFILSGVMFMQESKATERGLHTAWTDPLTFVSKLDKPSKCIAFILGFYDSILEYLNTSKVTASKRLTDRCIELVQDNLENPKLSVNWLASQIFINENYLSRQFRSETGEQLVKYIANQRLERAKQYLEKDSKNIQDVSYRSGFSDPLYFSKCFKKKYGISPTQFIQNGE
ncbi:MAG: response regulator [Sphaerochaeta sp.]|nr:response regulator [Sphaerochaeta sp.]